jgi:hypothetical protein
MELELGKINKQSRDDFVNCRDTKSEFYFIKKMVLNSMTYPNIKIEQLDLCPDGKEQFNLWLNISVSLTKYQLIDMLKVANSATDFELGGEEEFPAKITIETFPRKEDLEKFIK